MKKQSFILDFYFVEERLFGKPKTTFFHSHQCPKNKTIVPRVGDYCQIFEKDFAGTYLVKQVIIVPIGDDNKNVGAKIYLLKN